MTSIVEVTLLRVRLEKAERERDEARAALSVRYALSREIEEILGVPSVAATDEQLALGVAAARRIVSERDEARAALEKKARGRDKLLAACNRLFSAAKRANRDRNEAYDVIDEINKELNGALGEASSEGESLVDGIRRLRRKTIAVVRQR